MIPALPLLATLAFGVVPVDKDAVKKSVETVLGGKGYAFCHEPKYPLRGGEWRWCPLVGDKSEVCPALPAACQADPLDGWNELEGSEGRARAGKGVKLRPGEGADDDDEWTARRLRLPRLGGIGRVLLWILIGLGAAALVYAIVKNARKRRREEEERDAPPPPGSAEDAARAAARRVIETDVARLLARARAAAAAGRFEDAIDDAWAAVVRRLEGDGLIRVHPSRTNGDYLHDLRERADLKAQVRSIARDVERVQFGADEASSERFTSILDRVVPLVARALAGILVAVLLSPMLACDPRSIAHRGPPELSPSGTQGVMELMAGSGLEPHRRVKSFEKVRGESVQTLVLLPGVLVTAEDTDRLLRWVALGHTLILTGSQPALMARLHVGVESDADATVQPLRIAKAFAGELAGLRVIVPAGRHLVADESTPHARALLTRGRDRYAMVFDRWEAPGKATESSEPDDAPEWATTAETGSEREARDPLDLHGRVVVFADGQLFQNAMLPVGDDAAFLIALLAKNGPRVELAAEVTGRSPKTAVEAVTRGKLAPFLLQLGLLLALLFVWRGAAFGRPRDPSEVSRRRFVEHVRSLGGKYAKAGASRHAASLYAGYALERLRERIRLGERRGMTPLAEALSARTRRPLGEVMRVLVEAQTLRDGGAIGAKDDPATDLAIVRELSRLLEQTGGTR